MNNYELLLSHRTDLPEKRVCAGGVAPCAHPFFGNLSVWLSSYNYERYFSGKVMISRQ